MELRAADVKNVLTRTSGFLKTVTSHSLQPYRGCALGSSLCGVGCYVRHNRWITEGRPWGSFVEVRQNAAESYLAGYERERAWARRARGCFGVFLSSSTEPFMPQEHRFGVTRGVLEAMLESPPDLLVLQTHSHRVTAYVDLYRELRTRCELRVHVSIETDRERLPGLPPPASPVARRFEAARELKTAGIFTVITVAPLLPIADPERFFASIADAADAVVIDHFIEGDGTADGRRTRLTALPQAMEEVAAGSSELAYRDAMVRVARRHLPGRAGVNVDGFAGRYL